VAGNDGAGGVPAFLRLNPRKMGFRATVSSEVPAYNKGRVRCAHRSRHANQKLARKAHPT
jgi:hypothetical protein